MILQVEIKRVDDDSPKNGQSGGSNFMLTLIFAIIIVLGLHYYFTDESATELSSPQQAEVALEALGYQDYIYDTNAKYNDYVKGSLVADQLAQLDKMLEQEKQMGTKLDRKTMFAMAKDDIVVVEAYKRWNAAKKFYRSDSRQIYPDERDI